MFLEAELVGSELGIIFHLISTRQEFNDSKFAADQVRYQKRQEIKLRAKAKSIGLRTHSPGGRGVSSLGADSPVMKQAETAEEPGGAAVEVDRAEQW